jgi:hypothetical protein
MARCGSGARIDEGAIRLGNGRLGELNAFALIWLKAL